jgi:hypothetical protein
VPFTSASSQAESSKTVAMTEAAFAEQIACSSCFQPDSFPSYWNSNDNLSGGVVEWSRDDGSGEIAGLSGSMLFKSFQALEDAANASSYASDRHCSRKDAPRRSQPQYSILRKPSESQNEKGSNSAFDTGATSYGNRPFLGGYRSTLRDDSPANKQTSSEWNPIASIMHKYKSNSSGGAEENCSSSACDSKSCVDRKSPSSLSGSSSPDSGSISPPTDDKQDRSSFPATSEPSCDSFGDSSKACGSAETKGERKSAQKERILEEISAWFSDNQG